MVGADQPGQGRQRRVREQPAGGRVAADDPGRDAGRGRIGEVRQPAVPVAVVEDDRPRRRDIELRSAPRPWRRTSLADQAGFARARAAIGRGEVRVRPLGRVAGHPRDDGPRDRRRVEQHEGRRADPGGRQGGRRHRAPAVADDLELGDVQARPRGSRPRRRRRSRGSDGGRSSARSARARAGPPRRPAARSRRGRARRATRSARTRSRRGSAAAAGPPDRPR